MKSLPVKPVVCRYCSSSQRGFRCNFILLIICGFEVLLLTFSKWKSAAWWQLAAFTLLQRLAQWKRAQQETFFPKQASASTWNNNCSSTLGPLLCTVRHWLRCEDESLHSAECRLRVVLICDIPPTTPSNPSVVRPKTLTLLTAKAERVLKIVTERELHFRNEKSDSYLKCCLNTVKSHTFICVSHDQAYEYTSLVGWIGNAERGLAEMLLLQGWERGYIWPMWNQLLMSHENILQSLLFPWIWASSVQLVQEAAGVRERIWFEQFTGSFMWLKLVDKYLSFLIFKMLLIFMVFFLCCF